MVGLTGHICKIFKCIIYVANLRDLKLQKFTLNSPVTGMAVSVTAMQILPIVQSYSLVLGVLKYLFNYIINKFLLK